MDTTLGPADGHTLGVWVGVADGSLVGAEGVDDGSIVGLEMAASDGDCDGVAEGDTVGMLDGQDVGLADGDTLGAVEGLVEGLEDGTTVGTVEGRLVGFAHCPQEDPLDDTRVPVTELYVAVIPEIVTSDPVTALTPPPDTHGYVPCAVVASHSQLPCDPEAVLL